MSDLLSANFGSPQSKQQPTPNTMAAAATIAPSTLLTIVTGTTAIENITPPVTGQHVLYVVGAAAFTTVTTGNILNAVTATVDVPCTFLYNPNTAKYYAWANNVT